MEERLLVIDLLIGVVLASLLFVLRGPLLSMYKLTDTAAVWQIISL